MPIFDSVHHAVTIDFTDFSINSAYEEDIQLIIACTDTLGMPGMAQQGYLEVDGKRMLVCYICKNLAQHQSNHMQLNIAKAGDIMNNMFNKPVIAGMVFNPGDGEKISRSSH